jgi:drug/metabolite transporter (DMT)-like permease
MRHDGGPLDRVAAQRADDAARPSSAGANFRVHLSLLVVQLAFGSLAVEGKVAMGPSHGITPAALAMLRIAGTAAFFLAAHLVMRTPRVRAWADVARLVGLSLAGVVVNQALFLSGLSLTSPVSATLLVATIPVFAALVAAVTGRDRLGTRAVAGIALALLGMVVLSRFALPHRGDLLVVANAFSYALYVVFAKGMLERYGTVTVIGWVFGLGALLFAPVGAAALWREAPLWPASTVGLAAFIVLVPTLLAYGLNAWALRRASPTLVAVYIYLQPLVVVVLAWLQLGERLTLHTALGGLLILGGVGVVALRRSVRVSPRRVDEPATPGSSTRASP